MATIVVSNKTLWWYQERKERESNSSLATIVDSIETLWWYQALQRLNKYDLEFMVTNYSNEIEKSTKRV